MNEDTETVTPSIVEVLRKAKADGGLIRITEYQSSSTGEVADLTIRLIGREGYHQLIRDSLTVLRSGEIEKPADIDGETWIQAKLEQEASWVTTLVGGHDRDYGPTYTPTENGLYDTDPANPEVVVLNHLEEVEHKTLVASAKTVKSRPKTVAKQYIRSRTPVRRYLGRLILKPGKFEAIRNL